MFVKRSEHEALRGKVFCLEQKLTDLLQERECAKGNHFWELREWTHWDAGISPRSEFPYIHCKYCYARKEAKTTQALEGKNG